MLGAARVLLERSCGYVAAATAVPLERPWCGPKGDARATLERP